MPLRDLELSPRRRVPARLLSFRSVRAGGPGGQHVNKVATRVVVALDLDGLASVLGDAPVARIRRRLARRVDARGRLVVACGRTRSRARNLELAQRRLEELLGEALRSRPARRATGPSRASRARRLEGKRQRAATKRLRRAPGGDE